MQGQATQWRGETEDMCLTVIYYSSSLCPPLSPFSPKDQENVCPANFGICMELSKPQ